MLLFYPYQIINHFNIVGLLRKVLAAVGTQHSVSFRLLKEKDTGAEGNTVIWVMFKSQGMLAPSTYTT